jgi:hypothetical protein
MNQMNSLLSELKRIYSQQGQVGRIVIPVLFVLVFCCLCSLTLSLVSRRSPAPVTPSPGVFPTSDGLATPTALFDFDFPTLTPLPTLPPPSPFPTLTPLPTQTGSPTQTGAPTQTVPAATATLIPTNTATPAPPIPTATVIPGPVVIVSINKAQERVDIQNISPARVSLQGWRLVSEAGNQSCELNGTLAPNEVLRIWADRGPGFDCRLPNEIWLDNEPDPAILYDPQGQAVSRFP